MECLQLTGSGNLVGGDGRSLLRVDVDADAWVRHGVTAGELDGVLGGREGARATAEDELGAFGVELRGVGLVESEELVLDTTHLDI